MFFWPDDRRLLNEVNDKLDILLRQGAKVSQQLTDLIDAVHAESTVVDGAVVLIQGFNARLQTAIDNGADPAVLQSLVDETKAKTQQLADAVAEVPPATP